MPAKLKILLAIAISASFSQFASGSADNTGQIETIVVTGRAQSLYRASQSSVSTRIDADLSRTPAAVQIINAELIKDQGARDARDLYRNISGVSVFSYSGITFRGFRQDEVLYDGLRGDPYAGFTVPRTFGVDRIEVLKGPSGAIYGAGAPGGLINYATSQASLEQYGQVQIVAGDYDLTGVNMQATGAFGNSDLGYRIAMLKETEEPFRQNTTNDNDQGDLGLIWQPTADTSVQLKYSFVDQMLNANRLRGVPADKDGNFLVEPSWNHNEPTDFLSLSADVFYARLQHAFNDAVKLDMALRYYDNQEKQNYHEPRGLYDSNGDGTKDMMAREFRDQVRNNQGASAYVNLIYVFNTGKVNHQLLTGVDIFDQDSDFKAKRGSPVESGGIVPPLSLYNPLYGQTSRAQYGLDNRDWESESESGQTQQGLYVQDLIELSSRWDVLVSLRFNDFENRNAADQDSDTALTYRLGTVYHLTDDLNFYASYSEGFEPQNAANQSVEKGGPFKPEESESSELGAKLMLWSGRAQLNITAYEIEKRNVLQSDPAGDVGGDGVNDLIAIGKIRSRGVEVDLSADLLPYWTMTLNYAYNDTKVLEATSGITNATGSRFANTPRNLLGLWTRYDFPAINSALAFGVDYKDEQISISGDYVKPYTVFDASWQTSFRQWNFQLNVSNLFDKEYAESGFITRTGHFPGEPRRVIATISREF